MQLLTYTVLLVDDDEDDFLLMKIYFQKITIYSISLEWVDTYVKALQSFRQRLPDMLFVDYNLNSSCSGLDLVQELKGLNAAIPAILITGQDRAALGKHKAYALLDGYVNKNQLSSEVLTDMLCLFLK